MQLKPTHPSLEVQPRIEMSYAMKDYRPLSEIDNLKKTARKRIYSVAIYGRTTREKHRALKKWLIDNNLEMAEWVNWCLDQTLGTGTVVVE